MKNALRKKKYIVNEKEKDQPDLSSFASFMTVWTKQEKRTKKCAKKKMETKKKKVKHRNEYVRIIHALKLHFMLLMISKIQLITNIRLDRKRRK